MAARLLAVPDFLSDACARLADVAAPRVLVARARREAAAASDFLREDVRRHPDWREAWSGPAQNAAAAFDAYAQAIAELPDRDGACGRAHVELLMREAHGLAWDAAAAVTKAEADFDRLGDELVEMAAALDPSRSWAAQLEALAAEGVGEPAAVIERCRALDSHALGGGGALVTTAADYALDYRWLSPCFDRVAKALYFLPYRSPPAEGAGAGSVYWVQPPSGDRDAYLRAHSDAALKVIHAVHHGSVGHHTQNAYARRSASRMARLAGTDCALGVAMLGSGSMVEGWACYAQDLMQEVPGFYTPAERLFLKSLERRNAASVLVDIRLHTGEWSVEQAMAFYADQAGFAPGRVEGEVTRNLMLPATRLMYWLGVEQIRDLRARWRGDTRSFHDTLLGYGHVPVAWAGEEMARSGLLG